MAIYARQSGSTDISDSVLVTRLSEPILNGSLLVYDSEIGAFVNEVSGGIAVSNARNLGGAHTHGIFAGKDEDILEFKHIVAGSGIYVSSDGESLVIGANFASDILSVPGSYRVTIDNDNSGEGKFEVWTKRAVLESPLVISPSVIAPIVSSAIYTGNDNAANGYIQAMNDVSFQASGFSPGMHVVIDNAGNQDGTWQVYEVLQQNLNGNNLSTIVFTEEFSGDAAFNLGGPKPNVTIAQADFFIPEPEPLSSPYDPLLRYRLESFSIDFGPNGLSFEPGMVVELAGTADNDGFYIVEEIVPKGLTPFDHSSLLMNFEHPFVGTPGAQLGNITLTVQSLEQPTGFSTDRDGHLTAKSASFSGTVTLGENIRGAHQPEAHNDLIRKDNLDNIASKVSKPRIYFHAFL